MGWPMAREPCFLNYKQRKLRIAMQDNVEDTRFQFKLRLNPERLVNLIKFLKIT